jgi:hypothetical protein
MGFDIHLMSFKDGEPFAFSRSIIGEAFELPAGRTKLDGVVRGYPDGGALEIFDGGKPEMLGFMICRPPSAPKFWEGLFEIMRRTPSMLVCPGDPTLFLVASEEVLPHLPGELPTEPQLVSTPAELIAAIEGPSEQAANYVKHVRSIVNPTPGKSD